MKETLHLSDKVHWIPTQDYNAWKRGEGLYQPKNRTYKTFDELGPEYGDYRCLEWNEDCPFDLSDCCLESCPNYNNKSKGYDHYAVANAAKHYDNWIDSKLFHTLIGLCDEGFTFFTLKEEYYNA